MAKQTNLQMLDDIITNYECGFISAMEFVVQVDSLKFNYLERRAIKKAFDASLKFDLPEFRFNLL